MRLLKLSARDSTFFLSIETLEDRNVVFDYEQRDRRVALKGHSEFCHLKSGGWHAVTNREYKRFWEEC